MPTIDSLVKEAEEKYEETGENVNLDDVAHEVASDYVNTSDFGHLTVVLEKLSHIEVDLGNIGTATAESYLKALAQYVIVEKIMRELG